jgi:hypothetical protein
MKLIKNILMLIVLFNSVTFSANYYVSSDGNDNNNGTSTSTSWQTLSKVSGGSYNAGDLILFKRGDIFVGRLDVPSDGSSGSPVVFSSYGTGANPVIDANNIEEICISIPGKSYITIDSIDCRNGISRGIDGGSYSPYVIIRGSTISNIGTTNTNMLTAISLEGGHCTITHCTITNIAHLGIMFGGGNNVITYNDISYTNTYYTEWGAAIDGVGDNDEIAYNTLHDNGGVSDLRMAHGIYTGTGTISVNIHHNIITNSSRGAGIKCNGNAEIHHNYISGSYLGGFELGYNSTNNVVMDLYNNIITGNRGGIWELSKGTGALTINIYNNTFYLNNSGTYADGIVINHDLTALNIKNNIIQVDNGRYCYNMVAQTGATINNNCLYQVEKGTPFSYNGKYVTWATWQGYGFDTNGLNADPLVISSSNFNLHSGSPCIHTGVDVGLTRDFRGASIIGVPDIGAYEYTDANTLPVQVTSFTGVAQGNTVALDWKTATEVNSYTFEIERRTTAQLQWESIGTIPAAGTSNVPREYVYRDSLKNVSIGNIFYRLKSVNNDGSFQYNGEVQVFVTTVMGYSPKPTILCNLRAIAFGNVGIYDLSKTILKVTNSSVNILTIDSIYTHSGIFTSSPSFSQVTNIDTTTITVQFKPIKLGVFLDTLFLRNNSDTTLFTIPLLGETPAASISAEPFSISFGTVPKDSISQLPFAITNSSISVLQIDSLWTNTKYFHVTPMLAFGQIRIGDTTKVTIRFTPDSSRSFIDTLYIANNSFESPFKVPLSGDGTVTGTLTGIRQVLTETPTVFSLAQNFPNPFNPTTTINYQLQKAGNVSLKVYDMLGREAATLVNEEKTAGYYSATFDASRLSSGTYMYRLHAGSFIEVKKLVLLK